MPLHCLLLAASCLETLADAVFALAAAFELFCFLAIASADFAGMVCKMMLVGGREAKIMKVKQCTNQNWM